MKRLFLFFVWSLVFPITTSAAMLISSVMPNTTDDTNLEYIEFRNTGCESIDIGGYMIEDAVPNPYHFPTGTHLEAQSVLRLERPTSKIVLNNTNETLTLKDGSGIVLDTFSYATSTKWVAIDRTGIVDDICNPLENTGSTTETGATSSGITSSGSESGSGQIQVGSWSGTGSSAILIGSGITDTGTTLSGSTDTATGTHSSSGTLTDTGSTHTDSGSLDIGSWSIDTSTGNIDSWSGNISGSGTISDTGSLTQSGNTTQSGLSNTGIITPVFSGKLLADSLGYQDTDSDWYIDSIFLTYPQSLTGTLNTGHILLYSATGGLYGARVNTETGYILSGSLSGTTLSLYIKPATLKKSVLKVNNTTSSELRLRSTGNIGIKNLEWQELEDLFLTKSFGEYKNIIHPALHESGSWGNISPTQILTGGTNSGNIIPPLTSTGVTNTWDSLEAAFPIIIPTWQNYTNATLSGDILTCTTLPCRANLTLEPIFTGSFLAKNYTCEIRYATGVYDCNPPQLYLSGGESITIKLIHKTSWQSIKKVLTIIESLSPEAVSPIKQPTSPTRTTQKSLDTTPPIAVVRYDGKLKSYHEPLNDTEMNCYTWTCAINLTGEDSYNPEGWKLRFLWIFAPNDISTSRDPGEHKYTLWDHSIELRVIDEAGNFSSAKYSLHVLGPKEKEEKPPKEKIKTVKESKEKVQKSTPKKTKKKKKIPRTLLFDPPTIVLQKSKFESIEWGYLCRTTAKTCSLNLSLSGTTKWIMYTWDFDDGTKTTSKNPKAKSFAPWTHTITLTAGYDTNTPLWSETLKVQVIKTTKPKKPKATKPKKVVIPKAKKEVPVSEKSIQIEEAGIPYLPLLFIGWLSPLVLLRRRKK